ncbi:hypothetical protein F5Y12DRAFT_70627 [Xylaria sp. FL1777]|nr:hypothetical protein F5Y12DRAFT_70627 [Xylaria sp. FL1777]
MYALRSTQYAVMYAVDSAQHEVAQAPAIVSRLSRSRTSSTEPFQSRWCNDIGAHSCPYYVDPVGDHSWRLVYLVGNSSQRCGYYCLRLRGKTLPRLNFTDRQQYVLLHHILPLLLPNWPGRCIAHGAVHGIPAVESKYAYTLEPGGRECTHRPRALVAVLLSSLPSPSSPAALSVPKADACSTSHNGMRLGCYSASNSQKSGPWATMLDPPPYRT